MFQIYKGMFYSFLNANTEQILHSVIERNAPQNKMQAMTWTKISIQMA